MSRARNTYAFPGLEQNEYFTEKKTKQILLKKKQTKTNECALSVYYTHADIYCSNC